MYTAQRLSVGTIFDETSANGYRMKSIIIEIELPQPISSNKNALRIITRITATIKQWYGRKANVNFIGFGDGVEAVAFYGKGEQRK